MSKQELKISPRIIKIIVQCVSDAVGDKIKADVRQHKLRTQNSTPTRIWDLLNTGLCDSFSSPNCMAYSSKRGPWEMIIVYEQETGYVYTLMREKRYKDLHEHLRKRKRMHYVDLLVRHLNPDLLAPVGQMALEPFAFQDEAELPNLIQKLLENLLRDDAIVNRHVLVLFNSERFALSSIRAIMVDTSLDVYAEQSWNEYINIEESIVVGRVENPSDPSNNPARGLRLTPKATKRKKTNELRKNEEERKKEDK